MRAEYFISLLITVIGLASGIKMSKWKTPVNGMKYDEDFRMAEQYYHLPDGILSRMAYQESRYNPRAVSPVGAKGLMQFMPATAAEFGIDPMDPKASISAAGKYMKWLYKQTGSWPLALAAYNWGIGNIKRKGFENAPLETRNYVKQITDDVRVA